MSVASTKVASRRKRQRSLRKRLSGKPERPRVAVFRSLKHIYAQIVDDTTRRTLLAVSDLDESLGTDKVKKKDRAKQVGALLAKKCLEKGIGKVVFDRAGYRYHGRVSALADGAREGGLQF